jgi:hypothetical protein
MNGAIRHTEIHENYAKPLVTIKQVEEMCLQKNIVLQVADYFLKLSTHADWPYQNRISSGNNHNIL